MRPIIFLYRIRTIKSFGIIGDVYKTEEIKQKKNLLIEYKG